MAMKVQQIGEARQRDFDFQQKLAAAIGFFELRMWNEAWDELEELAPEFSHLPEVIIMRVLILSNLGRWEDAAIIGETEIPRYPDFGSLYLATAEALRHSKGAAEAKIMITAGEPLMRNAAIFHFTLACYNSALGHLGEAKRGFQRAFELDPSFISTLEETEARRAI